MDKNSFQSLLGIMNHQDIHEYLLAEHCTDAEIKTLFDEYVIKSSENAKEEASFREIDFSLDTLDSKLVTSCLVRYLSKYSLAIEILDVKLASNNETNVKLYGPEKELNEHIAHIQIFLSESLSNCKTKHQHYVCKTQIPEESLLVIGHKLHEVVIILSDRFGLKFSLENFSASSNVLEQAPFFMIAESDSFELLDAWFAQAQILMDPRNIHNLLPEIPQPAYQIVELSVKDYPELFERGHRILNYLARQSGVRFKVISAKENGKSSVVGIEIISGNDDARDIFESSIAQFKLDKILFLSELQERFNKNSIHIFVDISNTEIGAKLLSNNKIDHNVCINVEHLMDIVIDMRNPCSLLGAGSSNAGGFHRWKKHGFTVHTLERTNSGNEQVVDDLLHAHILQTVSKKYSTEHTLVILTGDGNSNNNRTSFPDAIEIALRESWRVEVWGWRSSMSSIYQKFLFNYSMKFSLRYLDEFRDLITYSSNVIEGNLPHSSQRNPSSPMKNFQHRGRHLAKNKSKQPSDNHIDYNQTINHFHQPMKTLKWRTQP